jgi:hypothetical protein
MPRIADALSPRQYEGTPVSEMATAAPPTYAQQAARIPGRVMDALRALGAGQTYGTAEPTNSISDLARARLGRGSVFGVPEDVQQRNVARATDIAMMAAPIVYHGSPHRFAPTAKNPLGEFDPTKIGTGEGAQAYGYGHYTAESPKVATDYRNALSGNHNLDQFQFTVNGNPTDSSVAKAIVRAGSPEAFIKGMQPKLDSLTEKAAKANKEELIPGLSDHDIAMLELKSHKAMIDEAKGYIGKTVKSEPLGTLYKVDLPDEVVPRMLDFDKHLAEQSPQVQKILSDYQKQLGTSFGRGDQVLKEIAFDRRMKGLDDSPAAVAKQLKELGIPGIQYLDAGSRRAGTGTRNYVVFPGNESLLKILGRE